MWAGWDMIQTNAVVPKSTVLVPCWNGYSPSFVDARQVFLSGLVKRTIGVRNSLKRKTKNERNEAHSSIMEQAVNSKHTDQRNGSSI